MSCGLGYGRAAVRLLRSAAEQWSAPARNPGTTDGSCAAGSPILNPKHQIFITWIRLIFFSKIRFYLVCKRADFLHLRNDNI